MVAASWGVFVWHEFRGANARAKMYLLLMFVFYIFAIIAVARANG
jgi:glucose uptake protein